jgi:hypothetical protein
VCLPLLTCSPSAWPSRLPYRRGRTYRRDLWITLYFQFISNNNLEHFFAHHQEVLYVQQLVYFSEYYVGWQLVGSEWNGMRTKYTNCCTNSASWWCANKCARHAEVLILINWKQILQLIYTVDPRVHDRLDIQTTWVTTNQGHLSYDPHGVRKRQSEPRYACLWT